MLTEGDLLRPGLSFGRGGMGMDTSRWFSRSRASISRSIFASCFAEVSWLEVSSVRCRFRAAGCKAATEALMPVSGT